MSLRIGNTLNNIYILFLCIAYFFYYYSGQSMWVIFIPLGLVGYFNSFIMKSFSQERKKRLLLLIFIFATGYLSYLYNNNTELGIMLFSFISFTGIAMFLKDNTFDYHFIFGINIMLWLFFFLAILSGQHPNFILNSASQNFISVMLFFFVFLLYIAATNHDRTVPYWVPIIILILCIWGIGRSGMLAAAILLGLTWMSNFKANSLLNKVLFVSMFIVILTISFGKVSDVLLNSTAIVRFMSLGFDGPRFDLWNAYIQTTSEWKNLLFGSRISQIPAAVIYHNNMHNSYFNLHSHYGISFLVLSVYLILRAMILFWKEQRMIFIISIVILIRAITDQVFFIFPNDIVFYYILFYGFHSKLSLQD